MRKTPIPEIPIFGDASPRQNPLALRAYRMAWFGMFPPLGTILGPLGFIFGIFALRAYRANPKIQGHAQARMAVLFGIIEGLSHWGGLFCLGRAFGWLGN